MNINYLISNVIREQDLFVKRFNKLPNFVDLGQKEMETLFENDMMDGYLCGLVVTKSSNNESSVLVRG